MGKIIFKNFTKLWIPSHQSLNACCMILNAHQCSGVHEDEAVLTEWFCPGDAFEGSVVPHFALTFTQAGTNSEFRSIP